MKCQNCEGAGGWLEDTPTFEIGPFYDCDFCSGTGKINLLKWASFEFWNRVPVWFIEWYNKKFHGAK